MSRFRKLFLVFVLVCSIFSVFGGRAEAASPATSVYDGESHTPTGYRQTCSAGTRVDFAVYPSNVSLNLTTGRMSYRINLAWRRCPNSGETRAYAIYASPEVCPLSGYYGERGTAHDCVKYIGNPPFIGPGNGLACPGGSNYQCVTGSFGAVQAVAQQPSTTTRTESIAMGANIPSWGSRPATGSYTVSSQMCQYYKYPAPNYGSSTTNRCVTVSITVRWRERVRPLTINCGGTTPATVQVGEPFTLRTSFTTAGGTGPGQARYTIRTYDFAEAGVPNGALAAVFGFVARNGGTGNGEIPNPIPGSGMTPVLNSPGLHQGYFMIEVTDASNSPRRCDFQIVAVERPYHKVYGGDVSAAGAFGSPCFDTDSRIIGFNAPNFAAFGLSVGSGAQLAAMALGTINEFGSGQLRNSSNPATISIKNLTFANTTPGYGGDLGDENAACAPDYWANATGIETGPLTIGGANLGMGQRITRYVQGDVRITGNITQASGAFNGIAQVPSYRLIVQGNIYVAPGVTELNGLFVAMPRAGVGNSGKFYTCSNGNYAPPTTAQVSGGACQNRLTVYGSVVADLIKFSRSGGSLRHACREERFDNTCPSGQLPAERFIYTPETWLTSDFGTDDGDLDSIRTLPPVL